MMVRCGGHFAPGEKAQVAFLSAHLGFREAKTPIEIYGVRMTETIAAAMKAGGLGTRWPRPRSQRRVMPDSEHPGMHIGSMTALARRPFTEVALVGGHLCLDVMRHLVGLFREHGHVIAEARVVEINRPIGRMRRDLRLWLEGDLEEHI